MTRKLPFQLLQHRDVGEGATPFPGLLHFTFDSYLMCFKKGSIKYHFCVFGMTRPGIELRSPGQLANTLLRPKSTRLNDFNIFLFTISVILFGIPSLLQISSLLRWFTRETYYVPKTVFLKYTSLNFKFH